MATGGKMKIEEIKKILNQPIKQEEKKLKNWKENLERDGIQGELIPQYDELLEDIKDIDRHICDGNEIMQMSNTQIQGLLRIRELEKEQMLKKIDFLVLIVRKTDAREKSLQETLVRLLKKLKEEKEKMQKIINIVKIIGYVISVILPLLDGAKGVSSKINEIYKTGE